MMKDDLIKRLITYAKMDTQSDENSDTTPSTPGQMELAHYLVDELKSIGLEDAAVDENGYVMATLPATTEKNVPTIGFLAHMDTATDFTGKNVKPQIIEDFNGKDIVLNKKQNIVLSSEEFPELPNYEGHTLITTDGTTLLGADNKAGISEIMTALAFMKNHADIEHGDIRVAFTPDEEIGRGPHKFDVARFGAEFAFTVDGGPLGELQYESFNAAAAKVTFKGSNVHPGTAKDKMVNSGKMAADFITLFPDMESPEHTEGYEGFYHLISVNGDVESTQVYYIIRDFDKDNFAKRKATVESFVGKMREKYGQNCVELEMTDQYYNMRDKIEPVKEIVDIASEAMKLNNIEPVIEPIRGGTDGSQLSYKGLPTPNIFTGGENFHGKFEYVSVDNMEKATKVIIEISRLFAKNY